MKCVVGIDLGSTTTKAVILDDQGKIIGRGITNSRSNYDVACDVARTEAYIDARFGLLGQRLGHLDSDGHLLARLTKAFRLQQYLQQLNNLNQRMAYWARGDRYADCRTELEDFLAHFSQEAEAYGERLFLGDEKPKSDFFRDLAGFCYNTEAARFCEENEMSFDVLLGIYDKSILEVENTPLDKGFGRQIRTAYTRLADEVTGSIFAMVDAIADEDLEEVNAVGTGYGRQRLPFDKAQIRSEILCHGLGAHAMYPNTATVLDIGGQDTKAIQVDPSGLVTSFQMNDRCAAGCGRYLGYIAEEMNLSLPELGPLAQSAAKAVKINSTCTVFAGAELRDRLSDGQKREEILLGLHRAIMYRAMSLLARSGGISNEFTFTGGVAKNAAAVEVLRELVTENYGEGIVLNINPDSIYTGALGAALFAHRDVCAGHLLEAV